MRCGLIEERDVLLIPSFLNSYNNLLDIIIDV